MTYPSVAYTNPSTRPVVMHIDSVHELDGCAGTERRRALKESLRHPRGGSHVVSAAAPFKRIPYGQRVEGD